MMEEMKLNSIEEAVEDFKKGEFVIVVDDEDRENEGDLIIAAEKITAEKVNFMLKNAVVCSAHLSPSNAVKSWICPIRYRTTPLCLALPLR